jgi:adenosine deaminase
VSRIDHGIAASDRQLAQRLVRDQIPSPCALSNVKLRVFDKMTDHNLKRLLDLGLRVTVNSDDPAYFGGYITENFLVAEGALKLDQNDIYQIARNSFLATFLGQQERQALLDELDSFMHRTMYDASGPMLSQVSESPISRARLT